MTNAIYRPLCSILVALSALLPAVSAARAESIKMTFANAIFKNEPVLAALENGFFSKHGLDVEIKEFSSGAQAGQTVVAGQAQMAWVGDFPMMRLAEASNGALVIASAFEWDNELYVGMASSRIKSAADLKGKVIATIKGSIPEYLVARYLNANGVSVSDVTIKNMQAPDMPIALDRGDVDAFFIWEPFGLQSKKLSGDKVRVLTTGKGLMRGYAVLAADTKWLKKNPDTAMRFLAAIRDGMEWIKANPEKAVELVTKRYGTDKKLAKYLFERENYALALDKTFYETFDGLSEFLRKNDLLKSKLEWSTLADPSALKKLDSALVTAPPN